MTDVGSSGYEDVVQVPPRSDDDPYIVGLSGERGRETRAVLQASGRAWPHVQLRTENVDLHTTFPRSARVGMPPLIALGVLVGVAAVLGLSVWIAGWALIAPAVAVGLPVLVLVIASFVALPGSGSAYQRLRQEAGGKAWLLVFYRTLDRSRPQYIRAGSLLAAYAAAGAVGWSADRVWPTWAAGVLAFVAFVVFGFWAVMWLDRVGRGMGTNSSFPLPTEVHRLSMVQALSWTALDTYPGEKKGPQRPLIFVSSYNEGFDGYVGGFIEGFLGGLSGPWGLAPGFPDVGDGFRPFLEYVDRTSFPLDHSFVAYPHCSVVDIRNALLVDRYYRSLRYEVGGDGSTREEGAVLTRQKFDQFLSRCRAALSSVPSRPDLEPPAASHSKEPVPRNLEIVDLDDRSTDPLMVRADDGGPGSTVTDGATTTTILVSVLPVPMDHCDSVREAIRTELDGGFPELTGPYAHADSPFARVFGTHLARLTVVSEWDQAGQPRPAIHFEEPLDEQPVRGWLVFSAQFDTIDGDRGVVDWLRRFHAVVGGKIIGSIWGPSCPLVEHDAGVRDADAWAQLVVESSHVPVVRHVDHAENTMWDVLRALHTHRVVTGHLLDRPEGGLDDFLSLRILPLDRNDR